MADASKTVEEGKTGTTVPATTAAESNPGAGGAQVASPPSKVGAQRGAARAAKAHFYRFSRVEEEGADDAKMILQVKFSSEHPVRRKAGKGEEAMGIAKAGEVYWEVLDHSSERSADFSELNSGTAPVLDEHDGGEQLGNVKRAVLGPDKAGRAALEFDGLTERSRARYAQMRSGRRPYISFGYDYTGYLGEVKLEDGRIGKRIAFKADEISSVWRPADPTAGTRRSAEGEWCCLKCAEMFAEDELDDDFLCAACGSSRTGQGGSKTRKFRAADKEFSHRELKCLVGVAADADKRFKVKRPNGDLVSSFYVDDIFQNGKEFFAIIYGWTPDLTIYKVDFTFDGEKVTLGDMAAVEPVVSYEPVSEARGGATRTEQSATRTAQGGATRPASGAVDSSGSSTSGIAPKLNISMKRDLNLDAGSETGGGGAGGAGLVEPVKGFRVRENGVELDLDEPKARSLAQTVVVQLNERQAKRAKARNEEIDAVVADYVKTHGQRVGTETVDGREEKFYVGDRIRALGLEYRAKDPEKYADSEVRGELKERCRVLVEKSSPPPRNVRAAILPAELSGRCSFQRILGEFFKTRREGDATGLNVETLKRMNCGAELEAHQEIKKRASEVPGGSKLFDDGGIHLPANSRLREFEESELRHQRDSLASDYPTAGALIQSQFLTIEELLRNAAVLTRMGATFIGGASGDLILPRAMSPTVAQSLAEGVPAALYDQNFDQIRFSPKRIGTAQAYSRLALIQAADSTNLASYILQDHMEVYGLYVDYMGLNGNGANDQPLGILNQPGISQVIFGGTPTYAQLVSFETNIRKFNVPGPIGFVTTSVGKGRLKVLPAQLVGATIVSGVTNALWNGDKLIDLEAMDSQQIPGDILLAAVWRYLLMVQFGGLNVLLNPYSLDTSDKWRLTLNAYWDCGLRRAQAVCRSGDSCNQ